MTRNKFQPVFQPPDPGHGRVGRCGEIHEMIRPASGCAACPGPTGKDIPGLTVGHRGRINLQGKRGPIDNGVGSIVGFRRLKPQGSALDIERMGDESRCQIKRVDPRAASDEQGVVCQGKMPANGQLLPGRLTPQIKHIGLGTRRSKERIIADDHVVAERS